MYLIKKSLHSAQKGYKKSQCNLFQQGPTTPLRQWGFWQCLLFSWTSLRGKHCRHPIAVMEVVDMFGQVRAA